PGVPLPQARVRGVCAGRRLPVLRARPDRPGSGRRPGQGARAGAPAANGGLVSRWPVAARLVLAALITAVALAVALWPRHAEPDRSEQAAPSSSASVPDELRVEAGLASCPQPSAG